MALFSIAQLWTHDCNVILSDRDHRGKDSDGG
jgi:hypothetical protein